jgi:CheY-like chemotaxis protein
MVQNNSSRKKILIVDDELMLLLSMQRLLGNLYDITIAAGAKEAIKIVDKQDTHFDLIIIDIYMPDINGVDLYHHIIKKNPSLKNNIIFMTGGNLTTEIKEFLTNNKNV